MNRLIVAEKPSGEVFRCMFLRIGFVCREVFLSAEIISKKIVMARTFLLCRIDVGSAFFIIAGGQSWISVFFLL